MTTWDSATNWHAIDEQRLALADVLDTLDHDNWSAPSLCAGWSVRDVAVHLTQSHAGAAELLVGAIRGRFRFDAMVYQMAVRDTADPVSLPARLRAMVGSKRRPPMTAEVDPLMDILVHTQDICVPLGIEHQMPTDAAVAVAQRLWHMRFPLNPQRALPGVRFVADDATFEAGSGRLERAPIREIVMALAGRPSQLSVAAPASDSA